MNQAHSSPHQKEADTCADGVLPEAVSWHQKRYLAQSRHRDQYLLNDRMNEALHLEAGTWIAREGVSKGLSG